MKYSRFKSGEQPERKERKEKSQIQIINFFENCHGNGRLGAPVLISPHTLMFSVLFFLILKTFYQQIHYGKVLKVVNQTERRIASNNTNPGPKTWPL